MSVFYEFKISVADKEDFEQSENLGDMGIKSEPEWEEISCVINLDQVSSFHENEKMTTKVFFKNDRLIVNCKYEDVKEIFRKHYGVYPERKHLDKKGIGPDEPIDHDRESSIWPEK